VTNTELTQAIAARAKRDGLTLEEARRVVVNEQMPRAAANAELAAQVAALIKAGVDPREAQRMLVNATAHATVPGLTPWRR
jgi:hypothetical protein